MDKRTVSGFIIFMAGIALAAGGLVLAYNEKPQLPVGPIIPHTNFAVTHDISAIDPLHPRELGELQMASVSTAAH